MVNSAGNEGEDVDDVGKLPKALGGGGNLGSPGAEEKIIVVSAIDDSDGAPGGDTFASFSNFGSQIDIAAPGVGILSLWVNGFLATADGTSMAAPHVTGTAALAIKAYRDANAGASPTPDQVANDLINNGFAQHGSSGFTDDPDHGGGDTHAPGSLDEPLVSAEPFATAGTPVSGADLEVTKSVNNATPGEGDSVTYTVTVDNNGPDDATGVEVTDALPTGVTYSSDSAGGSYNSGTGVWTVGSLADAASATLTIVAAVDAGTGGDTITNTASISASDQADPDATNNSASADITVAVPGGGGGEGNVRGTVTVGGAKESGVTVEVVDTGPTATTNKGGKYRLKDVTAGFHDIKATKGLLTETKSVEVIAGETVELNFDL